MISLLDVLTAVYIIGLPPAENVSVEGPLFLFWILCATTFIGACVLFIYGIFVFYLIPILRGAPIGTNRYDIIGNFLTRFL